MTDNELQPLVRSALDWEPSLNASRIDVAVEDGVVMLWGGVKSYAEKVEAERAATRVCGVKGVANDLVVELENGFERTDTELERAAAAALKWHAMVPDDLVTVSVTNGRVTLNGTVGWHYQREAAARAVSALVGVKTVVNNVRVEPLVKTADVQRKIEAAFRRSAEIDAQRINVRATDGKVVLNGIVRSWAERQEAERAAWSAPGVTEVDDLLAVVP